MKVFIPRTIQARLVLSHLLVSLISILLISIYAGSVLFNAVRSQVEHSYEDLAFSATNELEIPLAAFLSGVGSEADVAAAITHLFASKPEIHYTVYLPNGDAIVDSTGVLPPSANRVDNPEIWEAIEGESGEADYVSKNVQGNEVLQIAVRVVQSDQVIGVLHMQVPLEAAMQSARRSLGLLIISALLVSLGMGAVGYYLARTLAGPIENLTQTAASLSRGEYDARVVAPEEPQELYRLANAFNIMAERMQAYVHELRTFVANASHELRTPLTSIKLRVEALRNGALDDPPVTDRFLAEIESEVDRLGSMVNDMLDLSRIEGGLTSEQQVPVDLELIVNDVYETFRVRAHRASIHLVCSVEPNLPQILGSEDQMRRMLYNLVENAIKYTRHNGTVEIVLQRANDQNTICLLVKDTGFGIAKNHMPHIFERFYRVEATRPRFGPPQGTGLGLAIAKSIVENHGGKISVNSQIGTGSVFQIELPVLVEG
jgi:signal transduction histidine kinase